MLTFPRQWLALLPTLLICSCGTVRFYTQALGGQFEIWQKSRPNDEVRADPAVDRDVKERLALIEELRAFAASDLHLSKKSFGSYCDLKRPYVVWVVFAAPEFSVEARTWWYPFVGSLKYRGFFNEQDAKKEAGRLRAKGLDVFMGGVEAYSTLGYFKDPVLNTFLHRSDLELAELVFHELTHAKVFLPGDTDFNEAFATANAEEGVRRWLRSKGDAAGLREYESKLKRGREVINLLLDTRERLRGVYVQTFRTGEMKREAKQQVFEDMLRRAGVRGATTRIESSAQSWNNARLNTVSAYYTLVPGFARLLKKCGGNLEVFHRQVAGMRHLMPVQRIKMLTLKAPQAVREPAASVPAE